MPRDQPTLPSHDRVPRDRKRGLPCRGGRRAEAPQTHKAAPLSALCQQCDNVTRHGGGKANNSLVSPGQAGPPPVPIDPQSAWGSDGVQPVDIEAAHCTNSVISLDDSWVT